MIKYFLRFKAKYFPEKAPKYDTTHVYTDKKGNRYFEYVQDFPNDRKNVIMLSVKSLNYGIEKDDLFEGLENIQILAKSLTAQNCEKKSIELITQIAGLQSKTANVLQHNTYLKIALAYIKLEGEPDEYTENWMQKKFQLWGNDENCRAFFLAQAWNIHNESPILSTISVLEYLRQKELKFRPYNPTI